MRNYNGGPSECQGKSNAKQPARLTQRRFGNVAKQSGECISEQMVLEYRLMDLRRRGITTSESIIEQDDEVVSSYGGNKFIISFVQDNDGIYTSRTQWFGKTKVNTDCICPTLLSYLFYNVISKFNSDYITFFT